MLNAAHVVQQTRNMGEPDCFRAFLLHRGTLVVRSITVCEGLQVLWAIRKWFRVEGYMSSIHGWVLLATRA
jgi:hypothetical protein